MLDIMTNQQFENAYQRALSRSKEVEEREDVRQEEDQQSSLERQINRVLNDWLLNPHNHKKQTLKCPIILQSKLKDEFLKELNQMGWKVQNNGYDKYEGGYSYTIMKT